MGAVLYGFWLLENFFALMTGPCSDSNANYLKIMRSSSHVEVLEPTWLREKVVAEMRAAVGRHE